MLEIKPAAKIVIAFEGVEYPCTKPTMGAIIAHEKAMAEVKENGGSVSEVLLKLLAACGLPAEVASNLNAEQMEQVAGALVPSKKN